LREFAIAILVDRDMPDKTYDLCASLNMEKQICEAKAFLDARELVSSVHQFDMLVIMHPTWAIFDAMCHGAIVVTNQRNRYLWHLNNCVRSNPSLDDILTSIRYLAQKKHLMSVLSRQARTINRRCDRSKFAGSFLPSPRLVNRHLEPNLAPPVPTLPVLAPPEQDLPLTSEQAAVHLATTNPPLTVSVVIPCYNDEAVVADAVRSALSQTLDANVEIIVVDDGSVDGTRDVLAALDDSITVVFQKNQGPSSARNTGLRFLSPHSSYVAFLDSDDIWDNTFLEKMVGILRSSDERFGLAYCNTQVSLDGKPQSVMRPQYSWERLISSWGIIATGSFAIRREALDAAGLFDEEIERGEDLEWMWRVALYCDFLHVDEILHYYKRASAGQLATSAVNTTLLQQRRMRCISIRGKSSPPAPVGSSLIHPPVGIASAKHRRRR